MAENAEKQITTICINGFKLEALKGGLVGYDKRSAKLKLVNKNDAQQPRFRAGRIERNETIPDRQCALWRSSQTMEPAPESVERTVSQAPIRRIPEFKAHSGPDEAIRNVLKEKVQKQEQEKAITPKAIITSNKTGRACPREEEPKQKTAERPVLRIPRLTREEESAVEEAMIPEAVPEPEKEEVQAKRKPEIRIPELKAGMMQNKIQPSASKNDEDKKKIKVDAEESTNLEQSPPLVSPVEEHVEDEKAIEQEVLESAPSQETAPDQTTDTERPDVEEAIANPDHRVEEEAFESIQDVEDLEKTEAVERFTPPDNTMGLQKYLVCRKCGTIIKIYGTNRKARCCKQIMVTLVETAPESKDESGT
ncbi:MAG: hypothetical protein ABIK28_21835, partial [Planctomycetota bacterium]